MFDLAALTYPRVPVIGALSKIVGYNVRTSANMAQVQLLRHTKQEQAQSQVLEQRQSFEIVQTMLNVSVGHTTKFLLDS